MRDIDLDGRDEVFIESENFYTVFKPAYGGALFEFSSKERAVNYNDVLARRKEHYHEVSDTAPKKGDKGVTSIHELRKKIPDEMRSELAYDNHLRAILQDHFLSLKTTLDGYRLSDYSELGDFITGSYGYSISNEGITLVRSDTVLNRPVKVEKSFRLTGDGFVVDYMVEGNVKTLFGVELNLAVHSVMEEPGEFETEEFKVNDPHGIGRLRIELDTPARIWKYPIETLSQSESGWDFIQQGASYTILFPFRGDLRFTIKFLC